MSYRTLGLAASLLSLAGIVTPDGHLCRPVVTQAEFSIRVLSRAFDPAYRNAAQMTVDDHREVGRAQAIRGRDRAGAAGVGHEGTSSIR